MSAAERALAASGSGNSRTRSSSDRNVSLHSQVNGRTLKQHANEASSHYNAMPTERGERGFLHDERKSAEGEEGADTNRDCITQCRFERRIWASAVLRPGRLERGRGSNQCIYAVASHALFNRVRQLRSGWLGTKIGTSRLSGANHGSWEIHTVSLVWHGKPRFPPQSNRRPASGPYTRWRTLSRFVSSIHRQTIVALYLAKAPHLQAQ